MQFITHELKNENGMRALVTNVGCALISLTVPDKNGNPKDVVLGLDTAEAYLGKHYYLGTIIGRFGNRINKGTFTLDGVEYKLARNDGAHHLHGGTEGFDKKIWHVTEADAQRIVLSYTAADGEENYPGTLRVRCTYTLTGDNALHIGYYAETDTCTVCNLTNHSYFNLEGHDYPDIYDHRMQINADRLTAVDAGLIPTGAFTAVQGTPFDFTVAKPIGADIQKAAEVNNTGGYDHNYVLHDKKPADTAPVIAAIVSAPVSGITMTVLTDMPGMQFYTGNFINGSVTGKGVTYQKHSAFCLETQFYPDTPNHPGFPSCIVTKEHPFTSTTVYRFDTIPPLKS